MTWLSSFTPTPTASYSNGSSTILGRQTTDATVGPSISVSANKATISVNTVVSQSLSFGTAEGSTTIAGEITSVSGPSESQSRSSWVTQNTWDDGLQSSTAMAAPSIPSSVGPYIASQVTRLANISQALRSPKTLPFSSSVSSSSAALTAPAQSIALNQTFAPSTLLTSGVTSQFPSPTQSTSRFATGTTGAGPSTIYSVPITTTITSPPLAYFTSTASNSDWTKDTTTLIDGTIRPVMVGCRHCGGFHHGVVIAGLGGGSTDPARTGCESGSIFGSVFGCGSEFDFSPLPPFIIGVDGTPIEISDGGSDGSGHDGCENEDLCSLPTSNERKTPKATTSTLTPSSTSTLISSSITKTISSMSSGSSNEYMIFPTAGITSDELTALTETLTDELGTDNVLRVSLNDAGNQVMYVGYTSELSALNLQRINPMVCNTLLLLTSARTDV